VLKTAAGRGNIPLDWLLFLELAFCSSPSVSGNCFSFSAFVAGLTGGEWSSAVALEASEARESRSLFPAEYRFFGQIRE